jgi:hypothetical protein
MEKYSRKNTQLYIDVIEQIYASNIKVLRMESLLISLLRVINDAKVF